MLKRIMEHAVIIGTLCFTAGCASSGDTEKVAEGGVDNRGSDCILIRTIRDYRLLDDRNLLIYGPANRAYYVTLFRPSFELRSTFRMGFSSRDGQLCPFGGDGIVVGSLRREEIGVQSISRVSDEQAEQLLVRYGQKEPAEQEIAPPEEVEGAEIEELG